MICKSDQEATENIGCRQKEWKEGYENGVNKKSERMPIPMLAQWLLPRL